jgi:hypothetical protein
VKQQGREVGTTEPRGLLLLSRPGLLLLVLVCACVRWPLSSSASGSFDDPDSDF